MTAIPTELDSRVRAAAVAESAAEREALDRLREVTGAEDGAMERHSLRCALIGTRIADRRGLAVDRELLLIAGLLHDIGLYDGASGGGVYVTDGRDFAADFLAGREGWDAARTELCLNAIERHHELRPQWDAGAEVELLRRADLVDLSRGLLPLGADRDWLGALWRAVPRDGTYREIGRMVLKAARERPATLPRIFLRGG